MGNNSGERTNEHCLAALKMMSEHKVSPLPHAYEVYFSYVSNSNKDVRNAIDDILRDGKLPVREAIEAIYVEYLASSSVSDAILAISERLQEQIAQTSDITAGIARDTEDFSGFMNEAGLSLSTMKDPLKIVDTVKQMTGVSTKLSNESAAIATGLDAMAAVIKQLQVEVQSIRADAMTDPLTGVGNRRMLDKSIEVAVKHCRDAGRPLTVCMLDLDHFKAWNDTHGHHVGDLTLKKVAATLQEHVRESDVVVRYGGEEFVLLFPGVPIAAAAKVVERIKNILAQTTMQKRSTGETLGVVTASFGLAQMTDDDTTSTLMERADKHLYAAKDAGRNRLECGDDNMPPIEEIVDTFRHIASLSKVG